MADRSVKVTVGADVNPLKRAMQDGSRSVDQLTGAVTRSGDAGTSAFKKIGDGAVTAMKGIGAAEVVVGGLYASVMKTGIGFNSLQQTSRAALTAIMGSAEAANAQMDELFKFTQTSPLPKQVYIEAQQTLLGFGVEASKVIPILEAIDDTTIAIGGNAQTVSELTLILGQIQSQGKITGRELMRLGMHGVDAAKIIGDQMGVTAQTIRDKISDGAIDADMALSALATGLETRFGGAAEMVKKQLTGATDRVKAAWRDLGGDLSKDLVDPVSGGKLVDWLNDTADIIRAMTPPVVELHDAFTSAFTGPGIHTGLQSIVTWLKDLDPAQVQAFASRLGQLVPIISAVGAASLTMATSNVPVIGGLMKAIGPLPAALVAAALASPQLRGAITDLVTAARPLLDALAQLGGALLEAGQSIIDAGASLLTSLVPAVQALSTLLTPVVNLVAGAAHAFSLLPEPVKLFGLALIGLNLARQSTLLTGIVSSFKNFGEQMALQRGLAAASGVETGRFGAALATLKVNAERAGSSLINAFGGPLGLAVTAGVASIGLLAKAFEDAKPKVNDFTTAIDENTAALTENGARAIINELQRSDSVKHLDEFGVGLGEYTKAVIGEGDAYDVVRQKLLDYEAANWSNHLARDAVQKQIRQLDADHQKYAETVADTKAAIDAEREATGRSSDAWLEQQNAFDTARKALNGYTSAASTAGQVAGLVADDVDGLSDAVKGQVSAVLTLLSAAQQTRSALSGSLTGFVSPVGAYEAAQSKLQSALKSGGGGGGSSGMSSASTAVLDAAKKLADDAKRDRDAIDQRYTDMLDLAKAHYDEQLEAFTAARDAVKAAADEAQRSAQAFLANAKDRATAAKDEASALASLAGLGAQGSNLASALETQAVAQAKLNVAKSRQVQVERQLAATSDPKQRAELQDRLNTLIAQQASLQVVAASADKDAADARADLAENVDLSTDASKRALEAMKQQAKAAGDVIVKDEQAADVAEATAARKSKADDDYAASKAAADVKLKALQDQRDKDVKAAEAKYQQLLDEKQRAEEKSQKSSASHGGGVSGAAKKMAEDAKPSFAQYMEELRKQVEAQTNWKNNIIELASRVGPGVAAELAKMGPQAAPMVQMLVDQTDTKLQQWAPLFMKSTKAGTNAMLDELTAALDPTGELGLQLGDTFLASLIDGLKSQKKDADAIAEVKRIAKLLQNWVDSHEIKIKFTGEVSRVTGEKVFRNPGSMPGMARGGWIPGAASGEWITGGVPGRDSVLRWLMPGEAVIPTASAQANRSAVDALIQGRSIAPQVDMSVIVAELRRIRSSSGPITVNPPPSVDVSVLAREISRELAWQGAQ